MKLDLVFFSAALMIAAAGGCERAGPSGDGRAAATPPASASQPAATSPATAPALVLFDGFEGGALAPFWAPADYGSGRYVPGAVSLSSDYARSGRNSVKITVREGDVRQMGDDGKETERA